MIITQYTTEERLEEEGNTDMQQNCTGKNLNPEEMPIRTPQRELVAACTIFCCLVEPGQNMGYTLILLFSIKLVKM